MRTFWVAEFEYRPRLARVVGKATEQTITVESAEDVIDSSYIRPGRRLLKKGRFSRAFESKREAVEWLLSRIETEQERLSIKIAELHKTSKQLRGER